MSGLRGRLSRSEISLVAVALLLPVPLVALDGYSATVPDAIGDGLGSLVTLDAGDERSGVTARGKTEKNVSDERRSAKGSLRIGRGSLAPSRHASAATNGAASGESSSEGTHTATETADSPNRDAPGGGGASDGEGGGTGEDGGPGAGGGHSSSGSSGDQGSLGGRPVVAVTFARQGARTGAGASGNGVSLDLAAEEDGVGSGEEGSVELAVTDTGGSSPGAILGGPGAGSGSSLP